MISWLRKIAAAFIIFALCLLISQPVQASDTKSFPETIQPDIQRILNRGILVVGLCELYTPPFFYRKGEEFEELAGIDIKLAQDIGRKLGVEVEFRRLDSFDSVVDEVAQNNVDIGISNLSITFTRAQKVLFTQPYFNLHMGVLINLLRLPQVAGADSKDYDFNQPTVKMAVLANSSYEDFARLNFPLARHITYNSWKDMLAAAEMAEVDLAFYDEVAIERTLIDDPSTSLKFKYVKLTDFLDPIAIAVPPQSPHFFVWLKHFIDQYPVNQSLNYHLDQYFEDVNGKDSEVELQRHDSLKRRARQLRALQILISGLMILVGLFYFTRRKKPGKSRLKNSLRWMKSPWAIFSGMGLGIFYGFYFKEFTGTVAIFGDIYLTFLNMCSLPIMITAIITSVGKIFMTPDSGQYFKKLLILFFGIILTASALGVFAGIVTEPGSALNQSARETLGNQLSHYDHSTGLSAAEDTNMMSFLKRLIPANIFTALTDNDVLGILIFSIVLGISLGTLRNGAGKEVINQLDALFAAFINIINSSMYILPLALFCLMAKQISGVGIEIILAMSRFVFVYIGICILSIFGTIIMIGKVLKVSPLKVISSLKESLIVAFGTANSYGAMPFAISTLESTFKLDKRNTNLIMPLGLTICRPGTILNLALGTVFMAQLFGISIMADYNWAVIVFGVLLSGIAASGAPSAIELSMLSIVFGFLGLPLEIAIILLLSVDPITDSFRTVLNVVTSCAITSVIAQTDSENPPGPSQQA